jgi:hypothetical protein
MTIEAAIQLLGIAALCIAMLVMLVLVVCIIIDYTRGVEEGVGSLADEERDISNNQNKED